MHILEEFELRPLVHLELFGLDVSIDKAVIVLWVSAVLAATLFIYAGRRRGLVASGLKNAIEAVVEFLRADVVLEFMGRDGLPWLPFIGALFSFILLNNLLGLVPGSFSPTANINVTATLAVIVFFVIQTVGMVKQGGLGYWKNLVPKGIPVYVAVIAFLIEFLGLFLRPFSLAVRLFANLFAGHVVLLVFLTLIISFRSLVIAPLPLAGAVVMSILEIVFSFVQALVFALLSAIFIGAALHPEH